MSYATEVAADSPVADYTLDDTSGTTCTDSSGNGLNGTYQNSPTLSASPLITLGTAVTFNGSNQRVVNIPAGTLNLITGSGNALSVEAWFKTSTTGVVQFIFGGELSTGGQGFAVVIWNTNVIWFYDGSAWHADTITVTDGNRHYVAVTSDGTTFKIYIDGSLSTSGSCSATAAFTGTKTIACDTDGSSFPFHGTLDEVAIYNTALSATRVAAHYNAGIGNIVDADTVSGKTSISSTESTDFLDSQTILGATTPSGVEVPPATIYTDSATISSKTSLSTTETRQSVESTTVASTTTPLSTVESHTILDSGTISGKTTVTADERGPFADTGTVTGKTTPDVPVELQTTTKTFLDSSGAFVGEPITATIEIDVPNQAPSGGSSGGGIVVGGTGTPADPDTGTTYTTPGGYWGASDDDNGIIP